MKPDLTWDGKASISTLSGLPGRQLAAHNTDWPLVCVIAHIVLAQPPAVGANVWLLC